MSRFVLRKAQRDIVNTIKAEGATIKGIRQAATHAKVDYTFDHKLFFTATMPHGTSLNPRWLTSLRATLHKQKAS